MSVAPQGREGVFTALASAPLFFAMLPTGALFGKHFMAYNLRANAHGMHLLPCRPLG
jgi:hypothetical protein